MEQRTALLARMGEARQAFEAVVETLRERLDEEIEPGGWRVRDVLAHSAAWERVAARRIPARLAGDPIDLYDVDVLNAEVVASASDWPEQALLDEEREAYAALVAIAESAPEAACGPGGVVYGDVEGNVTEHYPEHLPALQALAARA